LGGDRAAIAAETDYIMQPDEASVSATRQQLSDRDGPADLMTGSVAPRTTDAARAARTGERAHLDRPSTWSRIEDAQSGTRLWWKPIYLRRPQWERGRSRASISERRQSALPVGPGGCPTGDGSVTSGPGVSSTRRLRCRRI